MRKTLIDPKKIIIPFLTLAFLINSWIPGITVNNLVEGSSHGRTAIVELYKSEVSAAQDYDSIPKSYNVRVFINDKEHEMTFAEGMGKPFIAKDRTFVPYRAMCGH